MKNKVTFLGVRGSIPVSGDAYRHYGCATTCYLLEMGEETILVDAGSGILNLPQPILDRPSITMFLTHPHLDHMIGLPMCPYLFRKGATLRMYAARRGDIDAAAQVKALVAPPLWPVETGSLPGDLVCGTLPTELHLNGILVESLEGVHPGGVSILRLTYSGSSVVIATDCTITEAFEPVLMKFAEGCDLFLCDGQYSDDEWPMHSTFGHSTWTAAARLAREAEAGVTRIVHHDPMHTDPILDSAAEQLKSICPHCAFAREGEVILF